MRIGPLDTATPSPKLRYIGFNVVPVTNAVTVTGELLGTTRRAARPDLPAGARQRSRPGRSRSAFRRAPIRTRCWSTWSEVDSLDGAGPNDRVFELDPEAGTLTFGDGKRGRIPPLVVDGRQRWWRCAIAGAAALPARWTPGTIIVSAAQFTGLAGVVNFVAARGGRDAETLDDGEAARAQGAVDAQPRGDGGRLRVDRAADAERCACGARSSCRAAVRLPAEATALQRRLCPPLLVAGTPPRPSRVRLRARPRNRLDHGRTGVLDRPPASASRAAGSRRLRPAAARSARRPRRRRSRRPAW